MIISEENKNGVTWVDVIDPGQGDLLTLAQRFNLHATSVQDCMEPEHLPKFEQIEHYRFVILRALDAEADRRSDSVQRLTNKLAIFFADDFILTFHRVRQPYVDKVFQRFRETDKYKKHCVHGIITDLMQQVAVTYDRGVLDVLQRFEAFESEVFRQDQRIKLQPIYLLKRRTSIIRRMLKMMEEPLDEVLREAHPDIQPHLQSVREHFAKLTYQLEEIRESLISLLSLQVSLSTQKTNEASHKANEVIRLLTILSAVIMPLNLIASIYGMNFAYIPETQWRFGYFAILGLMAAVGFGTLLWFRWKGWLNPRGPK